MTFIRVAGLAVLALFAPAAPASAENLAVPGLHQPVEIVKDHWGVAHIYAKDEHDLFFAQGYNVASDRLFQLEIWRRQATGTVAEILGPKEVTRDIGNRLFRYRGDMAKELDWYHPRGAAIINAFVDGINAYMAADCEGSFAADAGIQDAGYQARQMDAGRGDLPLQWAAGQCRQRDQHGLAVKALGAEKVKDLEHFQPGDPDLRIDPAIDTVAAVERTF